MSNLLLRAFGAVQDTATKVLYGQEKAVTKLHFRDLMDKNMNGEEVKMADFVGNVLLVLYDEYNSRGFKILAFPCNQFGGQEPGAHDEIIEFVKKFDIDMPEKLVFFEKADVNGSEAREVFTFLKQKLPNDDGTTDIRWNFAKFLVDHEGVPFKRYLPPTAPFDLRNDIEALLEKKKNASS